MEALEGPVPAIALQYHRQILAPKLSAPLSQKSLNLSAAADALLGGQPALCLDIIMQRLKSVEAVQNGQTWASAQKLELTPPEGSQLAGLEESKSAHRELREELKNKQAKSDYKGGKSKNEDAERGKGKKDKGKAKDKSKGEREKEK